MTDPSTLDIRIATDHNEGEGGAGAANAYNEAATAYASDPARVEAAAQAAAATVPGSFVKFPSMDAPPEPAVAAIEVTFDGAGWRIHDPTTPDEPVVFLKLQDAEQRANALARAAGRGVCIRDQGGDLVAMYAAEPPTA